MAVLHPPLHPSPPLLNLSHISHTSFSFLPSLWCASPLPQLPRSPTTEDLPQGPSLTGSSHHCSSFSSPKSHAHQIISPSLPYNHGMIQRSYWVHTFVSMQVPGSWGMNPEALYPSPTSQIPLCAILPRFMAGIFMTKPPSRSARTLHGEGSDQGGSD